MSTLVLPRSGVDARGRLRRTVAPPPETWPAGNAQLYRAFLRWLDPNGVPAARARTVLVAVRHVLAVLPSPGMPDALAAARGALLRDYASRGAAHGTLQHTARLCGSSSASWRSRPDSGQLPHYSRPPSGT